MAGFPRRSLVVLNEKDAGLLVIDKTIGAVQTAMIVLRHHGGGKPIEDAFVQNRLGMHGAM